MRHNEININIIHDRSVNVPNIQYTLIVSLTVKVFVWHVCQRETECTHCTDFAAICLNVYMKKFPAVPWFCSLVSDFVLVFDSYLPFSSSVFLCILLSDDMMPREASPVNNDFIYCYQASFQSFLLSSVETNRVEPVMGLTLLLQMDATRQVEHKGH